MSKGDTERASVSNTKKTMVTVVASVQVAGASGLGLVTLLQFEPAFILFLLVCILATLVAIGLFYRSKLAFVTEFVLLTPVCGLLLFQTGRRVWAISTGLWQDCPLAFAIGFLFEQAVLIPALCTGIVLLWCRSEFQKPGRMET